MPTASSGLLTLHSGLELLVSVLELPAKVLSVPFLESIPVAGGMHIMLLFWFIVVCLFFK